MRAASDGVDFQLWVTDGTSTGTMMIQPDIAPLAGPIDNNTTFTTYSGSLYYRAEYTSDGSELWKVTDNSVGINDINSELGLRVYPNPANDQLTVKVNPAIGYEAYQLSLSNSTGSKIKELQVTPLADHTFKINIATLEKGMYFLTISNGKVSATRRVVVY